MLPDRCNHTNIKQDSENAGRTNTECGGCKHWQTEFDKRECGVCSQGIGQPMCKMKETLNLINQRKANTHECVDAASNQRIYKELAKHWVSFVVCGVVLPKSRTELQGPTTRYNG